MSADKAKNNRSTYMQRLRKQLTDSTGIQINYASNKKWCLVIPSHYHCDLLIYNDALLNLQNKSNVDNLQTLLNSLSEGSFLPETHSDVTDVFKSEIENEIIIMLTKPEIISLAEDQINILPKLTATIRKYDPLNETALSLEINWFHKMGHHGRTLETYQRFCREYELLFGEKFNTEMEELIN
jgi:two-component SAPR family response regulator